MHGFQPWYFNRSEGSIPCVELSFVSIIPTLLATEGVPFSYDLMNIIDTGLPTTWIVTSLPPGLTSNSSGVISGTPTASGSYAVDVGADNDCTPDPGIYGSIQIDVS